MLELYHSSWKKFLTSRIINELHSIENQLGNNYTPAKENILRFMKNDLKKQKICIVGQDPYFSKAHGSLVANGRAFQPNNLENWAEPFKQVSLKNIIRLIHKGYNGIEEYAQIKKYSEILFEIQDGSFNILQPKDWFDSLESQGVLFLNRYLTTEIGKANAHRQVWDYFVSEVIKYIDEQMPDMIWFLWGNEALKCSNLLKHGTLYTCRHPMMCSSNYSDDFLKSDCIKKTTHLINWLG